MRPLALLVSVLMTARPRALVPAGKARACAGHGAWPSGWQA
jgi:hypothetical protein